MTDSVIMISEDGSKYKVPSDGVEEASNHGWKTEEQANQEKAFKAQVDAKNAPGFQQGDKLDTLAGNFLDTATAGLYPILEKHFSHRTPEEQKVLEAREAQSEAEQPILNKAASAAGFAGSLLVPGPGIIGNAAEKAILPISEIAAKAAGEAVAKEAVASTGRQIAAKVAKNAAMAEAYNAPSQIANLAVGDPNQAAESLGWTIGLAPVLGVGEHVLGKMIPKAAQLAKSLSPSLDQKALSQAGIDSSKLVKGSPQQQDILDLLKREDAYGKKLDPQTVIDDRMSKIQPLRDLLDNSDMQTKDLSPTEQSVHDTLQQSSPISPISDHLGVNPDTVKQQLMSEVMDSNPSLFTSDIYKNQTNDYSKMKDVFDKYGAAPTSFSNIDLLKQELSNLPDSGPIAKIKGQDITMKDMAIKKLQQHEDAQMTAGLQSLDADKLSEYLGHTKDLKAAQLMQDPTLQLPKQDLNITGAVGGVLGGLAGSAFGHPAIGAFLGSGGDPSAYKGILKAISKKAVLPFAIRGLSKLIDTTPEMFGNASARAANDAVDAHLSNIQSILMDGGEGKSKVVARAINPIASFLHGDTSGLSKDQQYTRATNAITNASSNPESIVDNIGALSAAYGDNPHLQNLIVQHNQNAINYLDSIMPKNPNPMQAFSKNEWQPNMKEKNDFINQLAIVDDPMIAIHKVAAGTLTSKDVTTLQTVYPTLYQKILGEVTKTSFSAGSHTIKNHVKVSSSILAQQPVIPSMQAANLNKIQSIYTQPPETRNPNGSAPSPSHTNAMSSSQGQALLTSTQKHE